MKVFSILILMFLFPSLALAAGGGEHGAIPVKAILIQALNFSILVGLLAYLLKKPAKDFFSSRGESFHEHLRKAEEAKERAETKKRTIKDRLESLHATAGDSTAKAKADAEELRHKIVEDAKTLAGKLKIESERTAQHELEKAVATVRDELIEAAMTSAEKNLATKVDATEQRRLQSEFVDKLQVVQ